MAIRIVAWLSSSRDVIIASISPITSSARASHVRSMAAAGRRRAIVWANGHWEGPVQFLAAPGFASSSVGDKMRTAADRHTCGSLASFLNIDDGHIGLRANGGDGENWHCDDVFEHWLTRFDACARGIPLASAD